MGILIGMDEAGYGPHLGPLVVAATAWHVDDSHWNADISPIKKSTRKRTARATAGSNSAVAVAKPRSASSSAAVAANPKSHPVDLYRVLRNIVAKRGSDRRIPIADSKVLYSPGLGLRQLERGLHAVLRTMQQTLSCWSEIVHYCGADPDGRHSRVCWPDGSNCKLPIDAADDELGRLEARMTKACDSARVRPLLIRARLVFPEQFNDVVAHYGTKGAALSHFTIGLLREVVDAVIRQPPVPSPQPPIHTVCDKHGGRNFYTAILQHHFSEHWIAPVYESHAESHYEWGEPESRMRVVFQVNGERFLPTALASMTAKYLRELAMRAFNEFWRTHLPELKPTAGYYRDAWRFKKEIADKQRELKIDDHLIWRAR